MPSDERTGVLVMAYGSPASQDDLVAYYTHIRRGSPPPDELVRELADRYDAIGGVSPLRARTDAQRAAIADALERIAPGTFVVALGQKHASPFIEDGVDTLAAEGVALVVGLVLAPHYSRGSVGQYLERAEQASRERGIHFTGIRSWHLLPELVTFVAQAVRDARATLPERHKILFTAHSLPERVLDGDPYPDELRATAAAVGEQLQLDPWGDWTLSWQSAGRTGDAWRGPDINELLVDLAGTGRAEGVLVCPIGFVADGLEILYDLDVQAARTASRLGLAFARAAVPNADPRVMGALATLVAEHARAASR